MLTTALDADRVNMVQLLCVAQCWEVLGGVDTTDPYVYSEAGSCFSLTIAGSGRASFACGVSPTFMPWCSKFCCSGVA